VQPDVIEGLLESESIARDYLLRFCWQGGSPHCPRCQCSKIYQLKEGRIRCSQCRYTFHDFSDRWINSARLTCRQWIRLVRLFEQDMSTRQISSSLSVSYDTAYRAVNAIRRSLPSSLESTTDDRCIEESPVFGINTLNGRIEADVVPDLRPKQVLAQNSRNTKLSSVVFSVSYDGYEALVFACTPQIYEPFRFWPPEVQVYPATAGGFLKYSSECLSKHRNISPKRFPLYYE